MPLLRIHLSGQVMAGPSQAGARVVGAASDDGLTVSNTVAARVPDERIGQLAKELSPSVSQVNGSVP